MSDGENNRADGRRKTILGGRIFDDEGRSADCMIADLSVGGARVKCDLEPPPGSRVSLKIDKFRDIRGADVVWWRDGWIGLRFVEKIRHPSPSLRRIFELVKQEAGLKTGGRGP